MSDKLETEMLYKELHAVIRRWMSEGDNLQAFSVIGALEAVKADYLDTLKKHKENKESSDDDS